MKNITETAGLSAKQFPKYPYFCQRTLLTPESNLEKYAEYHGRWGGMMDKAKAYPSKQGGVAVEETVYGFNIVVHKPTNTTELKRRVAQAHADAIIAKVKKLNCSSEQKRELINAICT